MSINTRNYAQRSNFLCGSSELKLLPFYVQSANVPGVNFALAEVGGRSGARISMSGDSVQFNALSLELIIDEDYQIYKDIMDVVFTHINVETGTFADFDFDFWMEVTDDMGKSVMKIEYYNCKIESVSDLSLDSMDDTTEITFSLDLKFDYFKIQKEEFIPTLMV